jgi:hypothetical protein
LLNDVHTVAMDRVLVQPQTDWSNN